jgi:hypothetical protein
METKKLIDEDMKIEHVNHVFDHENSRFGEVSGHLEKCHLYEIIQ